MPTNHSSSATAPKFALGRVLITQGALQVLGQDEVRAALVRHSAGDWGEIDEDDRRENELSLARGFRIVSAYRSASGARFWVVTEADRSATTILLPEEY